MIEQIKQFMSADLAKLNTIIKNDLNSDVVLIRQISHYIINSGGKRLRPLITLLCGRIAGDFDDDNVILHKMAAMIEYIHTATLLHDDVVDESGMRRGRKTANALFGNAASVLIGDFIYTRSFQMMVESNSLQVLKIMADSTNKISEGEVLQLLNIGRSDLTEDEYFAVISAKTAILFEAAARVAAKVAKAPTQIEDALAQYARALGIAFQIIDDVLDYTGNAETMGKNVGDDLLEGKVTLPLIHILKHGNATEKQIIIDGIDKPDTANVKQICSIVKNTGAIDYCISLAQAQVAIATDTLNIFPDSKYKTALHQLTQIATNRKA